MRFLSKAFVAPKLQTDITNENDVRQLHLSSSKDCYTSIVHAMKPLRKPLWRKRRTAARWWVPRTSKDIVLWHSEYTNSNRKVSLFWTCSFCSFAEVWRLDRLFESIMKSKQLSGKKDMGSNVELFANPEQECEETGRPPGHPCKSRFGSRIR